MAKEYKIDDLISSEELYHHGIKGQKWGVRKYQNKDGSLTPAGRERYKDSIADTKVYTKKGVAVTLKKQKTPLLAKGIQKVSSKAKKKKLRNQIL